MKHRVVENILPNFDALLFWQLVGRKMQRRKFGGSPGTIVLAVRASIAWVVLPAQDEQLSSAQTLRNARCFEA
jgi:hypothetical protein